MISKLHVESVEKPMKSVLNFENSINMKGGIL